MQLDTMLTVDEYTRLPRREGDRLELVRGLLVRHAHPTLLQARVAARIYDSLRRYAATAGGCVTFNSGFLLQDEPPTVRGPHIAFVGPNRPVDEAGVTRGGPDLAVEITGPSADGARAELLEKVFEYLDAGTGAVWVVDVSDRSVTVFERASEPSQYRDGEIIRSDGALPGFECMVTRFFD